MVNLRFGCLMDTSPTSSNILQHGIVKTAHRHSILSWNPASSSEERMMSEFRAPPHTHVRFFCVVQGMLYALEATITFRQQAKFLVPPATRGSQFSVGWFAGEATLSSSFTLHSLLNTSTPASQSSISRLSPPPFCPAPILIQCILEIAAN